MMDWLSHQFWNGGHFLGIEWGVWKVIGWAGNVVFFSRFFVQWYATEKKKRVVVPTAFWWLSLAGGMTLLSYAISRRDPVIITGQAMGIFVYVRNLMLTGSRLSQRGRDCTRSSFAARSTSEDCT